MSKLSERHRARRTHFTELLGGKCARCGTTEKLEFDHIDPSTKEFVIGERIGSHAYDRVLREVMKCQMLCQKCHWEKTRVDRNLQSCVHGTVNMYQTKKCRCVDCKNAWNKYMVPRKRQWRATKRTMGITPT